MTETDNLYSVRYHSKGQGDEGEALEEQFFQIYADKQFLRLPTRVRFGEVTGIQFDASAATQDISKLDQLGAHPTLRSYGLLHLHHAVKKDRIVPANLPVPQMVNYLIYNQLIHQRIFHHKLYRSLLIVFSPHQSQSDVFRIGREWETDILKVRDRLVLIESHLSKNGTLAFNLRFISNFDVFSDQLAQTHENILLEVGFALLQDKIECVHTPETSLLNYLKKLQDTYPANPYHNKTHGAAVAHSTSCLMHMLCIYEA